MSNNFLPNNGIIKKLGCLQIKIVRLTGGSFNNDMFFFGKIKTLGLFCPFPLMKHRWFKYFFGFICALY